MNRYLKTLFTALFVTCMGSSIAPSAADEVVIDFDSDEGDQFVREMEVTGAGEAFTLQLFASNLPEVYAWSVLLEF